MLPSHGKEMTTDGRQAAQAVDLMRSDCTDNRRRGANVKSSSPYYTLSQLASGQMMQRLCSAHP